MHLRVRLILAALAIAASGCGISGGFLRDSITTQKFDYQMRIQSLRVLRQVEGSASVGSVFCAIPLADRMYARAMQELHAQAKLDTNEVLANIREDQSYTWYLGFYCVNKLTVSADVVQLVPEGGAAPGAPGTFSPAPMPSVP